MVIASINANAMHVGRRLKTTYIVSDISPKYQWGLSTVRYSSEDSAVAAIKRAVLVVEAERYADNGEVSMNACLADAQW